MIYLQNPKKTEIRAFDKPQPAQAPIKILVPKMQNGKSVGGEFDEIEYAPQLSQNDKLIAELIADGWIELNDAAFAAWQAPAQAAAQVAAIKSRRLTLLSETDPIANRDNRQNAGLTSAQMTALAAKGKAITPAQRKELETYAQALRDLPETVKTWPVVTDAQWPTPPAWFVIMTNKTGA